MRPDRERSSRKHSCRSCFNYFRLLFLGRKCSGRTRSFGPTTDKQYPSASTLRSKVVALLAATSAIRFTCRSELSARPSSASLSDW
eukprot:5984687-Amphidinium_carterae.1